MMRARQARAHRAVTPLLVLVVLPLLVGVAAATLLRDTNRACFAAALVSTALVYACLDRLAPGGEWTWLATFLIAPLTIAFALAAVLVSFGRTHVRKRSHE